MALKHEPLAGVVDRDLEEALKTVLHPAQLAIVEDIAVLLDRLDRCQEPLQLYNFQVTLFHQMHRAQEAQASFNRALKRLASGKSPSRAESDWPTVCAADSALPEGWKLEQRVAERAVRQLRTVGDALAWKVYRYDRRGIIALAQNDASGPFIGKAGLGHELGAVQQRFKDRGHFSLLHDLTNVLRIGDLTECHANGYLELDEVKASDTPSSRSERAKQVRRAQAAIDSIAGTVPLLAMPEAKDEDAVQHIWASSVTYRSDSNQLENLARRAHEGPGWDVRSVGQGRVLAIMDLHRAAQNEDAKGTLAAYERRRAQVLNRVGTERAHLLRGSSADTASRATSIAPFSIFPIPADLRARLICDQVVAEMFIPVERVAAALTRAGCRVEVLLPNESTKLDAGHDVLAAWRGSKRLLMHGPCVGQLLLEVMDLSRWGRACRELIDATDPAPNPVLVLADEGTYWSCGLSALPA